MNEKMKIFGTIIENARNKALGREVSGIDKN